jgi:hypothetical protein
MILSFEQMSLGRGKGQTCTGFASARHTHSYCQYKFFSNQIPLLAALTPESAPDHESQTRLSRFSHFFEGRGECASDLYGHLTGSESVGKQVRLPHADSENST